MFPNHLIFLRGDIGWPLDRLIKTCDFFLSGYLKSKVFSYRPRSLEELKRAMRCPKMSQNDLTQYSPIFIFGYSVLKLLLFHPK